MSKEADAAITLYRAVRAGTLAGSEKKILLTQQNNRQAKFRPEDQNSGRRMSYC